MSDATTYRAKSDELMRAATAAENLGERSRLISEAVGWNMMAQAAEQLHLIEPLVVPVAAKAEHEPGDVDR